MQVVIFPEVGSDFSDFRVELHIVMFLLAKDDGVFEMEVKQDNHFTIARLVEGMLNVIIQDVHLVTAH